MLYQLYAGQRLFGGAAGENIPKRVEDFIIEHLSNMGLADSAYPADCLFNNVPGESHAEKMDISVRMLQIQPC